MNTLVNAVITSLDSKFVELKAIREKRQARILSFYSETNNGLSPNEDCNGRLHAPCNGYEDIDGKGLYSKGEYLPIPEFVFELLELEGITCERGEGVFGQRTRILLPLEQATELALTLNQNYGLDSTKGKVFERDNIETCYLYVTGNDALVKTIEEAMKAHKESERESRKALKGTAPEGRVTVTAKLLKVYVIPPLCSWDAPSLKMLVELENKATAYGTLPKAVHSAAVGDIFNLKGTFKHAQDDETHAFVSRPTIVK